jgi:hypothetical protein
MKFRIRILTRNDGEIYHEPQVKEKWYTPWVGIIQNTGHFTEAKYGGLGTLCENQKNAIDIINDFYKQEKRYKEYDNNSKIAKVDYLQISPDVLESKND